MPDVTTKKIRIEALVPLDAELMGKKELVLAEKAQALAKEKDDAAATARASRKRQKDLTADIARISKERLDGAALGMVDAEERHDFDRFEVVTVRLDTSEIASVRPMSAEERQQKLDLDLDADPPSGKPADGGGTGKTVRVKGGGKAAKGARAAAH